MDKDQKNNILESDNDFQSQKQEKASTGFNDRLKKMVFQWHQNSKTLTSQQCLERFLKTYRAENWIELHFDDNLSQNILQPFKKSHQFLCFDLRKYPNPLRKTAQEINETLYENGYISKRQHQTFVSNFPDSLQENVYLLEDWLKEQGFLQDHTKRTSKESLKGEALKTMIACRQQELTNFWKEILIVEPIEFWKYVCQCRVEEKVLLKIYKIYKPYLSSLEQQKEFVDQLSKYMRAFYDKLSAENSLKKRQIRMQNSKEEFETQLRLGIERVSMYCNESLIEKYHHQYLEISTLLKNLSNHPNISFDTFGSFKSRFFLVGNSDIDIVLISGIANYDKRENKGKVLNRIQKALNENKNLLPRYINSKVFDFEKIEHPFVKVMYHNYVRRQIRCPQDYSNNQRDLELVRSMDIVINNTKGLENSRLLAMYSEDKQVLIFGNFVKLWAIQFDLINQTKKIDGMSSYGVILMVLYYLMVTHQIPFLRLNKKTKKSLYFEQSLLKREDDENWNQKYDVGLKHFRLEKSLQENFLGFLQFYMVEPPEDMRYQSARGQFGRFHREKKLVCLLEEHQGFYAYEDDLIINMHDFIDGSNPGRMKKRLLRKFNQIFEESYTMVRASELAFLKRIFEKSDSE